MTTSSGLVVCAEASPGQAIIAAVVRKSIRRMSASGPRRRVTASRVCHPEQSSTRAVKGRDSGVPPLLPLSVARLAQYHHALAVVLELHARRRQAIEVHARGGRRAARGGAIPAVHVVRTHMTLDGRLVHE